MDHNEHSKQKSDQKDEPSVWDDPDLVPVPVVPAFSDQNMSYEVNDVMQGTNTIKENQMRLYAEAMQTNNQRMMANGSSIGQDQTLAGLYNMVPDIIATEEYKSIEQHKDNNQISPQIREFEGTQHSYLNLQGQ